MEIFLRMLLQQLLKAVFLKIDFFKLLGLLTEDSQIISKLLLFN